MATVNYFDKIINVTFTTQTGLTEVVSCPIIGQKPDISIKGELTPQLIISNMEMRITNLYLKNSLDNYNSFSIQAGYANKLGLEITGQVDLTNSYVESPSPDGVTVFELKVGNVTSWLTKTINIAMEPNQTLGSVVNAIASQLGLTPVLNYINTLACPFYYNGLAKDGLMKLKGMFPNLLIRPDGNFLYVWRWDEGTGVTYIIENVTQAVKSAGGFTIVLPCDFSLRPGDTVIINPKYFKQQFGGQFNTSTKFLIATISYNFGTNNLWNSMNLVSVATGS